MNEYRYADLELRQSEDGRPVIAGTIIRYGDVATFPWGTEEFVAGAFRGNYAPLVYANRMHERSQPLGVLGENLRIVDDEESMRAELELPDTSYGRDTEVEVKLRILRGLSLEFRSIEDTVNEEKQHRRISKAILVRLRGGGPARVSAERDSAFVARIPLCAWHGGARGNADRAKGNPTWWSRPLWSRSTRK